MKVDIYIYKIQREFAEDIDSRYIAQAHRFGTSQHKWIEAESIVELHHQMEPPLHDLNWREIEAALDARGGFGCSFEIDEAEFSQLFSVYTYGMAQTHSTVQ